MTESPELSKPAAVRVCGIGASAGGVEALQHFFAAIPPDLGLAYVVIVHLAPDHKSELPSIIARWTSMPVLQVVDHQQEVLAPNHVYVIAPDRKLEISHSTISASPFDQPRGQRTAIDLFFRSLALTHGDGFAVVLSGSGSDGAVGARLLKERGGLVLVQDPSEASHGSMPRAAIAAGVADLVLPVRALANQLAELTRNKERVATLIGAEAHPFDIPEAEDQALRNLLDLIWKRTGHDFSKYKRSTVLRRLSRRMQLVHQLTIPAYLQYLRAEPGEVKALFDDLLISVTTFFRDPPTWAALREQVIVPLLEATDSGDPIRAWVAGCATGEEAYSLAILLEEELELRHTHRNVVIFASDVDETALGHAREGLYPQAIAADVSDARLDRYFRVDDSHYQVARELRDRVVFAAHSVLRDPPFSRIDLIACRNVLIYFDRDLQDQVMRVFRYACADNGYLFLGASENADEDLFRAVDRKSRIFAARPTLDGARPALPEIMAAPGTRHAPALTRLADSRPTTTESHLSALEEMAPPSVLADERGHVLHLSAGASHFFRQSGGPLAKRLTDLVRPELRDDIYTLLHQAAAGTAAQVSSFVPVVFDGSTHRVALLCQKRVRQGQVEILLTFLDGGEIVDTAGSPRLDAIDQPMRELRDQLRQAERRAENIRDEHSLTNEELRAANEELQSLNEEYRSTTEELETSKEELQSVNEELQTLNHELKLKLDEISHAHNDLENLMAATNVATLFLNEDLRIKRYTPQLEDIVNIRPRDLDRPISDLTHALDYTTLEQDARRVLQGGTSVERETASRDGRRFIVRLAPYRSDSYSVTGVVVTFIDVTALKRVEAALLESQGRLEAELSVMQRLHDMALHVATATSIQDALEHVLTAAIALHVADAGTVQLLDSGAHQLTIAAQRGFSFPFLERFATVTLDDETTWARCVQTRQIRQVSDVLADATTPPREVASVDRYRAVQTTPLISRSGGLVGVLSVHFYDPHNFTERDSQLGALLGSQAAELIESRTQQLDASASKLTTAEVRDLFRRLVTVQEEERRRIAREIHDHMGQQMTGLRMTLEALRGKLESSPDLREEVRKSERLVGELDQSVDFLAWQLRPATLDHLGLPETLDDLVRTWSERVGVAAECRVLGAETHSLPAETTINLYRIAQEALQNIHKHAHADHVSVVFEIRDRLAILIIEDNGRGFTVTQSPARDQPTMGLINMRERTLLMGGELEIESTPSGGTTVFVRVPL